MTETGAECDDGTIVAALFMEIGIRPSLQGYDYLKEAVLLYKKHNGVMKNITKEISERYNVPIAKVDKTMRAALNYVQDQGKFNRLNAILKNRLYTAEYDYRYERILSVDFGIHK